MENFLKRPDVGEDLCSSWGHTAQFVQRLDDFELAYGCVLPQRTMEIADIDRIVISHANPTISLAHDEFSGRSAESIAAKEPDEGVLDPLLIKARDPLLTVGPPFGLEPPVRQAAAGRPAEIWVRYPVCR